MRKIALLLLALLECAVPWPAWAESVDVPMEGLCFEETLVQDGDEEPITGPDAAAGENPAVVEKEPTKEKGIAGGRTLGENCYTIDVALDVETNVLSGTAIISFTNTSGDAWSEICLRDLIQSIWADAKARGTEPTVVSGIRDVTLAATGEALPFSAKRDDPSVIYVRLPKPLQPGESTDIRATYASEVPGGGFRMAWFSDYEDEPWPPEHRTYELAYFYPTLAMYTERGWSESPYFLDGECDFNPVSTYDVTVHVPEGYRVIGGGETCQLSDTEWRLNGTHMRDFMLVVSNELEQLDGRSGDVAIHSYCFRDDAGSHRQGELMLETAQNAVEAFEQAYGPYPFDKLEVVESNYEYAGMEHTGLVRISTMYSWELLGEAGAEALQKLIDDVAHEVAHQWFYAAVGNDPYNEAWLDESFAAYSELVYRRFVHESEKQLAEAMKQMKESVDLRYTGAINRSYDALLADEYNYINAVYKRGKLFLYELEQFIGAEDFRNFMREWYQSHVFQTVTTADFLSALELYMEKDDGLRSMVNEYLEIP